MFWFLVHAGCTLGFVGGGWSPWTRMFLGVIGVAPTEMLE